MPLGSVEMSALEKSVGLAAGIMIGGVLGPIVFLSIGIRSFIAAVALGAGAGAALGFLTVCALRAFRRRRHDRELRQTACVMKAEAKLPESVDIKVRDRVLMLEGEVDYYFQRQETERVLSLLPGLQAIRNRIRLRGSPKEVNPKEIKRRIEDRFDRSVDLDGGKIRVLVDRSRVILEGEVRSTHEALEAEELAWNVPGIVEVENRLQIAA